MDFKLEVYDGPLEMLLSLLQKHKLNIFDIPVSLICDQYIAELDKMRSMDMEVTSEFLVMASQLLLMKSRAILGTEDEAEQDEMTVEELQERLALYQKVKETAQILSGIQNASYDNFFKDTEVLDFEFRSTEQIDTAQLVNALALVLSRVEDKKPPSRESFKGIVHRDKISLTDKINEVKKIVQLRKTTSFESVFDGVSSRYEAITIFLAVLHLISFGKIIMRENGNEITLCSNGDTYEK